MATPDPTTSATTVVNLLIQTLNEELGEIVTVMKSTSEYLVEIPAVGSADLSSSELSDLVAKTANSYARIARLSAIANAQYKLSKGAFDRAFKKAKIGPSESVREKNAMEACEDLHAQMSAADALASLAGGLEQAARVSSESARKIYKHVEQSFVAEGREQTGYHDPSSYTDF